MPVDTSKDGWITALALALIQQQTAIEEFLRKAKKLTAFRDRIAEWHRKYGVTAADATAKGLELLRIVWEFGLEPFVPVTVSAGTLGGAPIVRTSGAVRTRGGVPGARRGDVLARVAAAYGRRT